MENRTSLYRPPAPYPGEAKEGWRDFRNYVGSDPLSMIPKELYECAVFQFDDVEPLKFLINEPKLLSRVLEEQRASFSKSGGLAELMKPILHNGLFSAEGVDWKDQHEMVTPIFSNTSVRISFGYIQEALSSFGERLQAYADSGKTIKLAEEINFLIADINFRCVFSKPIEIQLEHQCFNSIMKYEEEVTETASDLNQRYGKSEPAFTDAALKTAEDVRKVISQIIDDHIHNRPPNSQNFFQVLQNARVPSTGKHFTRSQLIDQVASIFLSSHETTSAALCWSIFILAQCPKIVERIRSEVQMVTASARISYEHLPRLRFTRDVFKEVLRLYPPVLYLSRVAREDTLLGNTLIPKESMVIISPWIVHRHNSFWENPDQFDPDRFSRGEAKATLGSYFPFGLGPRMCTGASYVTFLGIKVIAQLCTMFDFETLNTDEVRPDSSLYLKPSRPVLCKVHKRKNST
ncbi:Bifunctional P-450/NADPH-P450 reductase [Pseudovibrio axinellae]|uniref:Bifunctional P-450/NADPH-P450 reductase n=1 Tax=Pseudovibrio axinellae TaxID=989403 RepID=A0A165UN16_9HYPH|nr:cytochrome P450 [Pseudovibrio axinellae]KZL12587.1 Bifunctional P-450/NADPH-P450 reductase [Pseudovibrio axinellae]SEP65600.1 Cytochrome P450 [Pseudovibrio axinellae]